MPVDKLEISWRSAVRFFAIGIFIFAIYFFRDLIAIFLSSIVIATIAEGPVRKLLRRNWPRFAAVTLIYLGGFVVVTLLVYFLSPIVTNELRGATTTLLEVSERFLRSEFSALDIVEELQKNFVRTLQGLGNGAGAAFNVAHRLISGALSVVLAFVISFYLALQGQTIERLLRVVVSDHKIEYALGLWARSQRKIGRWFYGQMILSCFVGVFTFLGLWIMGVNYAFALGILAAVLEIVPVVGPLIVGVVSVVIAAQQNVNLAVYAVILFAVIQQVENNVFVPAVMKRSIGLNPVLVVFVLLIGGKLLGFWGMILAVPITAALSELGKDWEEKRLPT
ncbi:MAG: AI-2E family transporter [Parcubacteria group bacterium]|nr:AI-2E family transporter [Parcubacteria group bacterium]